jgi:hypothetical protein
MKLKIANGGGSITSDISSLGAIDGIESLILAAACQGIDVTTPAFVAAIETAVEAAANNA